MGVSEVNVLMIEVIKLIHEVEDFLKTELKMKEDDIQQLAYNEMHSVGVKRPHTAHCRDILIKFTDHKSKTCMIRHVLCV